MTVRSILVLLSTLCLFSSSLYAQSITVNGHLIDPSTEAPVPGIEVQVVGMLETVLSDEQGYFELESVPTGPQTIHFYNKELRVRSLEVELGTNSLQDLGDLTIDVATASALAEEIPTIAIDRAHLPEICAQSSLSIDF